MEIADKDQEGANSQYKVLKMVSGEDVLCKVLQEYTDAYVVEVPMSVTKTQVMDRPDHMVEHTGLQRWIGFTNDIKYVIPKEKILGLANLAPEVKLYYKMISRKAKQESLLDKMENNNKSEDEILNKLKNNMEKLAAIMEKEVDTESDMEEEITLEESDTRILH